MIPWSKFTYLKFQDCYSALLNYTTSFSRILRWCIKRSLVTLKLKVVNCVWIIEAKTLWRIELCWLNCGFGGFELHYLCKYGELHYLCTYEELNYLCKYEGNINYLHLNVISKWRRLVLPEIGFYLMVEKTMKILNFLYYPWIGEQKISLITEIYSVRAYVNPGFSLQKNKYKFVSRWLNKMSVLKKISRKRRNKTRLLKI